MGGIRSRLAVALVVLVAITVLAIGVGTYLFVDARLRESLLADATRQAQFNLSVLVPDALPAGTTSDTFGSTGLPEAFRIRGDVEEIVDFGSGQPYVSDASLTGAIDSLPADLRSTVGAGHLGYAWLMLGGNPVLVVGGRATTAAGAPGPDIYFVFPAGSIDLAMGQLRLGLAVAAVVALLLALATAGLVARGILRPVRSGSEAAARIAAGDLSARVPGGGSDEFAAWAAEFNRMADSLASTISRLEVSESQNRRFVAEVSHELRTPLTALVGEASLIEAALGDLPPDARRAAELLVADVRRLRTLVEDLMELSRFDARAETAELGPVDLGSAVASIVAARLPDARLSAPSHPIVIESDIRRLDRIVGNLLDNARTHAPGTPVDVGVSRASDGGTATVTVADRGPGVPADALERLFDRFYKADPSRRGGTSGMGLAIAAEHAALLGGELSAAERDDGGLVFTLRLPVTKPLPDGDVVVTDGEDAPGQPDASSAPAVPRTTR
jgi:signal transduction histidine kinase